MLFEAVETHKAIDPVPVTLAAGAVSRQSRE